MIGQQFDARDESTGHADMLRRIRAEQIQHEPEPAHEPSWVEDYVMCEPDPIRHWCCDWHEHHAEA